MKSVLVIINVDRGPHFEIEGRNYHSSGGGQPVGFVGPSPRLLPVLCEARIARLLRLTLDRALHRVSLSQPEFTARVVLRHG